MIDKVSIIVPVYNIENYIRVCVESILAQTYESFELILVDDGSKDNSGILCDEYAAIDSRVKVIHKENGGVSSARNTGLQQAKGKWIMYVDGDDWIEPDMIESLIETAKATEADLVFGDYMKYGPYAGNHKLPTWSTDKKAEFTAAHKLRCADTMEWRIV